jgi:hypothetical protein
LSSNEKVILKNLLLYLKTKSLTSENVFKRESREIDNMMMDLLGVFQRYYDNAPDADKQALSSMLDLVLLVSQQVHFSHRQAESTINDFKNYVMALEGSYKSVDGDFEKTVTQPAEREAEAKDKEEEERSKALSEYSKKVRPRFYE